MGPVQRIGATLRQARPIGRASFGTRQRLQASGSRSAMPEPTVSMTADDDLPRTIRRERDAQREREARERETREREAHERQARERQPATIAMPAPRRDSEIALEPTRAPPATVIDFDVPI